MKNRWPLALVLFLAWPSGSLAQIPNQDPENETDPAAVASRMQQMIPRLFNTVQKMGSWEQHSDYFLDAVQKIYERNGWTSEPDQFALELTRQLETLPPLALRERYDLAIGLMADRYLLNEQQEVALRDILKREGREMFQRNPVRLLESAGTFLEMLDARASGEAFTPEQVSQWVAKQEPLFQDFRQSLGHATETFMQVLEPEQREIVQKDMDAAKHRLDGFDQQIKKWSHGGWNPHDWGMEEDPIQQAGQAKSKGEPEGAKHEPANAAEANAPAGAAPNDANAALASPNNPRLAAQSVEEDEWARYVRAFIRKYKLDNGQQQQAWRIHKEFTGRADNVRRQSTKQANELRNRAKGREAAVQLELQKLGEREKASTDRLFQQLKEKLNGIPTRAQRRSAGPDEADPSAAPPGQPAPAIQTPAEGP